jgi:capsular polysaccharide export protein
LDLAQRAMERLLAQRLSKYSGAPLLEQLEENGKSNVLIVDQVKDDASLVHGCEDGFQVSKLIQLAQAENPNSNLYLKLHPETLSGFRKGALDSDSYRKVKLITEDVNPFSVLEQMDKVYVATSQMGFEALMLGKEVVCAGMPFYAGWGLTDDRMVCERRTKKRSVIEIFAAAYIRYTQYVNPITKKPCDILEAIEILSRQRNTFIGKGNTVYCVGIRHWKRYNIIPYLKRLASNVRFVKDIAKARAEGLRKGDNVVVWGKRYPDGLDDVVTITGNKPYRMEDGFVRSVGLGSDFTQPYSLVLDDEGIYFDPRTPSRLEKLLLTTDFTKALKDEAFSARDKLIRKRLTKYNSEKDKLIDLFDVSGRKVIFVPGQVADDASIQLGCVDINTNEALLRTVREENPNAYIIYKPHPDVSSGNRKGKVSAQVIKECCDQLVVDASIPGCLSVADEVHTMTSLVGFEALMRNLSVHVYGLPFYAGWGLTHDRHTIPRRNRQLSIDELVAGALLLYPQYYDWESQYFASCGDIIDILHQQKVVDEKKRFFSKIDSGYFERQLRKLILIIKGLAYAH